MRRTTTMRCVTALPAIAALSLTVSACGGGNAPSAQSQSAAASASAAAGKALTSADLPVGLTVATVRPDDALLRAAQAAEGIEQSTITPEPCKAKSAAAQAEVRDTVSAGVQQTVAKGDAVLYGVTFLPSEARLEVFEASATGECAQLTFGGNATQTTVRKALPSGVDATGFVFDITRASGEQKLNPVSAYFTKNGVVALVNANPGADGAVDQAAFDDMVRRVAAKL